MSCFVCLEKSEKSAVPGAGNQTKGRTRMQTMTMCSSLPVRLRIRTTLGEVFVTLECQICRDQKNSIRRNLIKIRLACLLVGVRKQSHTYLERNRRLPDGHVPDSLWFGRWPSACSSKVSATCPRRPRMERSQRRVDIKKSGGAIGRKVYVYYYRYVSFAKLRP